ncbi:MAG: hypothetical protein ACI4KF_04920 [Huintestinicola sp.]
MPAKFHLPDFLNHFPLNIKLIDMINEHPDYFYDGVGIASVYGCFPPSIWNGGRNINGSATPKMIEYTMKELNSRGIPLRFTFTNPLIREEHLGDKFCNMLLDMCDNGLNECIVNSPILEDYIRRTHPNYKLTSSTCKEIRDLDMLKAEIAKDYSLVVLDYNWNNNYEVLEQLPSKEKLEILVCPYCFPNCKRRGEHYRFLGEQQIKRASANMMMGINVVGEKTFVCEAQSWNFLDTIGQSCFISVDDMYNKYVPMGYSQFKIEGRTVHPLNVIESYVYYMVKPEYKDKVRLELGLHYFRMPT